MTVFATQQTASDSILMAAQMLRSQALRGRVGAKARLRRVYGADFDTDGNLPDLAVALDVVAKERGFADWSTILKGSTAPDETRECAVWLAQRYMNGAAVDKASLESLQSSAAATQLGVRLARLDKNLEMADLDALDVNAAVQHLEISALVILCCTKHGANQSELRERRRIWVQTLLKHGANPNDGMRERDTIRGFKTCLGGAIGSAQDAEIVRLLLDHGADAADGPTLYEGSSMWEAVRHGDHDSLDLLLAAKPPQWHVCHALTHAMQFQDELMIEKLLNNGGDPNWNQTIYGMRGNALHEAIQCDCDRSILDLLIQHGAELDAKDEGGRSPSRVAVALGRDDLAKTLKAHGADQADVTDLDHLLNKCFRNEDELVADQRGTSKYLRPMSYHEHLWLHEALARGSHKTLATLLELGFDANVIDYQGDTPLHRAVRQSDEFAVQQLLANNANPCLTNFEGDTVVELALRNADRGNNHLIDMLASNLSVEQFDTVGSRLIENDIEDFESAVDALATGDTVRLRELLDQHPYFARARSIRPHRCTLMNYIGVNGFEGERQVSPDNAVEIIELLLERGCDPNAVCYTYRGGPGETTLGLLLSSGVVESKAQQIAMVRTLVRGGAAIAAPYRLAFRLQDAQDAGTVDSAIAELNVTNDEVVGAFFALAEQEELALLKKLLDAGFDVNATNDLSQTVTHWAAFNGNAKLVDWLIEHGADLTLRELQFDGTVAGWADAGGHPELAKTLAKLADNAR
ncbi:MAG: hypothetical protein F4W90_07440 [Gammaproteobacteria bacterium]|nr:hypothetical protein [Gammaproteobacteria bacterium]